MTVFGELHAPTTLLSNELSFVRIPHSVVSTSIESLHYLLAFYDLEVFYYMCSATGRQVETWS